MIEKKSEGMGRIFWLSFITALIQAWVIDRSGIPQGVPVLGLPPVAFVMVSTMFVGTFATAMALRSIEGYSGQLKESVLLNEIQAENIITISAYANLMMERYPDWCPSKEDIEKKVEQLKSQA